MPETHPPPEQDALSPERRQRIVDGAAAVFIRDGYEGASMSKIAAAAQVSKGTPYNYFENKQALFAAVVRQRCARLLLEAFGGATEPPPPGDLPTELARIGRAMLNMTISPDGNAMYRLVVMEASKFPELADTFYKAGPDVITGQMRAWLARQIEAGHLRPHDTYFASEQFFALTQARVAVRTRIDASYRPQSGEMELVINGAVDMFLALYGTQARA